MANDLPIAGINSAAQVFNTVLNTNKDNRANLDSDLHKVAFFEKFKNVFTKVNITEDRITISGINCNLLFDRLKEHYGEKSFHHIFLKEYNAKHLKKFENKKMGRQQMQVISVDFPLFFALEIAIIFKELYNDYHIAAYLKISNIIREKTWVNNLTKTPDIMTSGVQSKLSNIIYTLKDYQLEFIEAYLGLKKTFGLDGYLLSFDQGLGKTLTSIALGEVLEKNSIVIVCPNSLKENWAYEIKEYFTKYKNDERAWKEEVCVVDNNKYKFSEKTKYLIVNMESIPKVFPYLRPNKNTMLIVDESHNFRNYSGKRVKELLDLKAKMKCTDILPMSGTPIKATPNEIVPTLALIDPLFTDECANIYNKAFKMDTIGAKSVVNARFGLVMHRKLKSDVLRLPEKKKSNLAVTISGADKYSLVEIKEQIQKVFNQYMLEEAPKMIEYKEEFEKYVYKYSSANSTDRKRYQKYLEDIASRKELEYHEIDEQFFDSFIDNFVLPNMTDVNEIKNLKFYTTKFIRIKQSCMGRAIGLILPKARAEMYIAMWNENRNEFIDRIVNNTKKTVIFSQLRPVIEHISKDLEKNKVGNVMIIGGTANRMDLIQEFKSDDFTQVLLATSQTLSTGVTLIEANQMFFFGPPWRSADYEQACDRIYRIGQTDNVNIYNVELSSREKNLSNRMNDILNWSNDMFNSMVEDSGNTVNEQVIDVITNTLMMEALTIFNDY